MHIVQFDCSCQVQKCHGYRGSMRYTSLDTCVYEYNAVGLEQRQIERIT